MTTPLSAIRARLAASTPGGWRMDRGEYGELSIAKNGWGGGGPNLYRAPGEEGFSADPYYPQDEKDGDFIAHAPDDIAYLLRVADAAEALMLMGQHDGPCDNGDGMEDACTLHLQSAEVRRDALRAALEGEE